MFRIAAGLIKAFISTVWHQLCVIFILTTVIIAAPINYNYTGQSRCRLIYYQRLYKISYLMLVIFLNLLLECFIIIDYWVLLALFCSLGKTVIRLFQIREHHLVFPETSCNLCLACSILLSFYVQKAEIGVDSLSMMSPHTSVLLHSRQVT